MKTDFLDVIRANALAILENIEQGAPEAPPRQRIKIPRQLAEAMHYRRQRIFKDRYVEARRNYERAADDSYCWEPQRPARKPKLN